MERIVQQTDYDALSCKLAAISKGYLPSDLLQVKRCNYHNYKEIHIEYLNSLKGISRRTYSKVCSAMRNSFPVMNYGTYLRTVSIDIHVNDFIKAQNSSETVQVINLGCGSDLRMIPILKNFQNVNYIDIDYKESIELKKKTLYQNDNLRNVLKLNENGEGDRYKLISCDLNDCKHTSVVLKGLTHPCLPTLIITECVLCYMKETAAKDLIDCVREFYKSGLWISYDPIGGSKDDDRFGIIMQSNLRESRCLEMPTLMVYNSKDAYGNRFPNCEITIKDMWEIFEGNVPIEEVKRLKSLQFLDEIEELRIMQTHYVFSEARW